MKYLWLQPSSKLPDISELHPFRCVVIVEESVTPEWQSQVSSWLVVSGCLYMMAWGENCSNWDDSVDHANLEFFDYKEIPDENFVMTTWHDKEPIKEVFWFSKNNAFHPIINIKNTLILHISKNKMENEVLEKYNDAT